MVLWLWPQTAAGATDFHRVSRTTRGLCFAVICSHLSHGSFFKLYLIKKTGGASPSLTRRRAVGWGPSGEQGQLAGTALLCSLLSVLSVLPPYPCASFPWSLPGSLPGIRCSVAPSSLNLSKTHQQKSPCIILTNNFLLFRWDLFFC